MGLNANATSAGILLDINVRRIEESAMVEREYGWRGI